MPRELFHFAYVLYVCKRGSSHLRRARGFRALLYDLCVLHMFCIYFTMSFKCCSLCAVRSAYGLLLCKEDWLTGWLPCLPAWPAGWLAP